MTARKQVEPEEVEPKLYPHGVFIGGDAETTHIDGVEYHVVDGRVDEAV